MSKKNKISWKTGICDSHKYALSDTRRRKVFYCSICDANLCKECANNPVRRSKAMMIREIEGLRKELKQEKKFSEIFN